MDKQHFSVSMRCCYAVATANIILTTNVE